MKHIIRLSSPVQKANSLSLGSYIMLAGQILGILAGMFEGKEILKPDTSSDESE
ncbi:MAG: DUF2268 domain-containing protein [Candidatus Hydrogenedens sp.]|jgi:hypothetical protein|nr:DUF2268 domain-containing protein [Candidatus Hydrogenedens sp.]